MFQGDQNVSKPFMGMSEVFQGVPVGFMEISEVFQGISRHSMKHTEMQVLEELLGNFTEFLVRIKAILKAFQYGRSGTLKS